MNSILSSVFVGWYINCRNMHGIVIRRKKLYELARQCKNVDTLNKCSKESRGFVEGDSDVIHKFFNNSPSVNIPHIHWQLSSEAFMLYFKLKGIKFSPKSLSRIFVTYCSFVGI